MTNILVKMNYTLVVRICQEGMKKGIFTESWGKSSLGGAPAGAQSYWQGRFAACTFLERV